MMLQKNTKSKEGNIIIIGAGPAGLGCAYELGKKQTQQQLPKILLIEKNDMVGGLARTNSYKGYRFDIGPHRFFTKNDEILDLWKNALGNQFTEVPRLTRMFYKNKFFLYPVQFKNVLQKLGFQDNIQSFSSFLYAKIFLRKMQPKNFEDWITKNFGKKLFTVFFKTYTEKLWGISCREIGVEWADQRIKNMDFWEVLKTAILGQRVRQAKSLVGKFYYPLLGAGQMYQKLAGTLKEKECLLELNSKVQKIYHQKNKIISLEYQQREKVTKQEVDFLFSSMPLTKFILCMAPQPPKNVVAAAKKLLFRDHITVNLIIKKNPFPDNWIYIHSPEVKMVRVVNYSNFSDKMSKDKKHSVVSVEYFAFQGDEIWTLNDKELIKLAKKELERVKLLTESDVIDGFVVRETEAYPTYFIGHKKYLDTIKNYLSNFTNLQLIGRGGMFKYNNMDHSIYSGILAARNYLSGEKKYDLWEINEDAEYLEEKR
ncbi:MAG: FAD-dependent oxidoreductase [Patescibacteria group bacterium]|nr:FAD-dependent oxidoreductase [Patescibacteria group bacterium]